MKLNSEQSNHLQSLLTLNQEISQRMPQWNQGMGGNISVKMEGELMAIKPSGLRLDELKSAEDFAYINFQDFLSFLTRLTAAGSALAEKEYAYSQEIEKFKKIGWNQRRASMEAGFHAALGGRYVLHIHHLNSVAFVDLLPEAENSDFYRQWQNYFQIVPYRRPGWELSAYFIKNRMQNPLILMKNHGAILRIDDPSEFTQFLEFDRELEKWLANKLGDSWASAQKILRSRKLLGAAPFKYFYPDVAIFENRLRKFLKVENQTEFSMASDTQEVSQDLLENWQAMLYLHQLRPQMIGLSIEDAESLRGMPSEMARVAQMISLAVPPPVQGRKR